MKKSKSLAASSITEVIVWPRKITYVTRYTPSVYFIRILAMACGRATVFVVDKNV